MVKEPIEFEPEEMPIRRLSPGDRAFLDEDFSKAYFHYVRENDTEGLNRLAKFLEKKGKKEDAVNVLAKARQLSEMDKKVDK